MTAVDGPGSCGLEGRSSHGAPSLVNAPLLRSHPANRGWESLRNREERLKVGRDKRLKLFRSIPLE